MTRHRPRPPRVLLVEDYAIDARYLVELFAALPPEGRPAVEHVTTVADAEQALAARSFDCVLLDLGLPDGDGVENVQRVRAADRRVTIVVMTGRDDEQRAIEALQLGAQEYLVKGRLDHAQLMRHLRHAMQRHELMAHLDREREQQKHLAGHDALTGLVNRQLFAERARDALAQARRLQTRLAFWFIDLDGFKSINDRLGHAAGDAALVAVADALRATARSGETVARIGGDEFVVMQIMAGDDDAVRQSGERLLRAIRGVRQIGTQPVALDASAGVSLFPDHGDSVEALLLYADEQMYRVKHGAGDPTRGTRADELPLHEAGLVYQPWTGAAGATGGVEALLRQRRDGSWSSAEDLLQAAAQRGLHGLLSNWVLRTACGHWSRWQSQVPDCGRLAVNMSAADLADPRFPQTVLAILEDADLRPDRLQIEIAESQLDAPGPALLHTLAALRAAGVRVVVDQFGRERASLRLLADLPLDGVKLHPRVVRALDEPGRGPRALMAGIIAAAQWRGLEVVAVGVEHDAQAQACVDLSCAALQGLWYAGWVGAEELPSLLDGPSQHERRSWLGDPARRARH